MSFSTSEVRVDHIAITLKKFKVVATGNVACDVTLKRSIGNIAAWGAMVPSSLNSPLPISQKIVYWVTY